jgi:hypothetical protein
MVLFFFFFPSFRLPMKSPLLSLSLSLSLSKIYTHIILLISWMLIFKCDWLHCYWICSLLCIYKTFVALIMWSNWLISVQTDICLQIGRGEIFTQQLICFVFYFNLVWPSSLSSASNHTPAVDC